MEEALRPRVQVTPFQFTLSVSKRAHGDAQKSFHSYYATMISSGQNGNLLRNMFQLLVQNTIQCTGNLDHILKIITERLETLRMDDVVDVRGVPTI